MTIISPLCGLCLLTELGTKTAPQTINLQYLLSSSSSFPLVSPPLAPDWSLAEFRRQSGVTEFLVTKKPIYSSCGDCRLSQEGRSSSGRAGKPPCRLPRQPSPPGRLDGPDPGARQRAGQTGLLEEAGVSPTLALSQMLSALF